MLLENFRSVQILLENKKNGVIRNKTLTHLVNWLLRFDNWYKEETGINNDYNLHYLYNREISISGKSILENISSLDCLLNFCSQSDFILSIKLNLKECYEFYSELEILIDNFMPYSLVIEIENIDLQKYPPDFITCLIEKLVINKINLTFVGPISFWLEKGICNSLSLGARVYNIMPQSKNLKRQFFGNYNPCAKKFVFVIDFDGLIYPCMGLVGIPSCSLGTIQEPLSVIWKLMKHHSLNIEKLAYQGPSLDLLNIEQNDFTSICKAHRHVFLPQ